MATTDPTRQAGIIGRSVEEARPVIWSFVNEFPSAAERDGLAWLTVISWRYDRAERNGMPPEATNQRMLALEDALQVLEAPGQCRSAYRRTGNGLKEFVFYIHDRDGFMARLNAVLAGEERYPIEVRFYEDPDWSDFRKLLEDFAGAGKGANADGDGSASGGPVV